MFEEQLNSLYYFFEKNRSVRNVFFPIGLSIWTDKQLIGTWINHKANKDSMISKEHHAEHLILESLGKQNEPVDMLITVPPCSVCLKKLEETNKLRTIYVLFDPMGKLKKKSWVNSQINFALVENDNDKIDFMWEAFKTKMETPSHRRSLRDLLEKQESTTLRRVM